jgi:diaminopimelate decarboxylase
VSTEVAALADRFGTPLYVYDGGELIAAWRRLRDPLPAAVQVLYSVKANPNISVCALLRSLGAGAEVCSETELLTALRAGVDPADIVFLGPGKSARELHACVRHRVGVVVCESVAELVALDAVAAEDGNRVAVALRINPRAAAAGARLAMGGRPRQFGIDEEQLRGGDLRPGRYRHLRLMGFHAYSGTRILDPAAVVANTVATLALAEELSGLLDIPLDFVDVGGGIGVAYHDGETDPDLGALGAALAAPLELFAARHPHTRLAVEAGRYLTATAGTYVARVLYVKSSRGRRFAVLDGGTNHHLAALGAGGVVRRNYPMRLLGRDADGPLASWTVTGPLCTPTDTLGSDVQLPELRPGDLIGVLRTGAYGPSASPGLFLGHGFPAEVLVHDGRAHLVRERDTPDSILDRQRLVTFPEGAVRV